MTARPARLMAFALGLAGACVNLDPFGCLDDVQCDAAPGGACIDGFCAFPDPGCESGYRFHETAGGALSGRCVDAAVAGTESGSSSGDSGGPSTTDATEGETLQVDGTGDSESSAGSTDDSGSEDSSSGSTGIDACGGGPCPCTEKIVVARRHSCALRSDGSIACWGDNIFGNLGTGMSTPPAIDDPVIHDLVGTTYVDVAAGRHHSCGTSALGEVFCWGRNQVGQASSTEFDPVQPMSDNGVVDAALLSIGSQSSCTDDGAGMLTCWGSSSSGQLGGTGPSPVTSGPHLAAPVGYTHGERHACMWDDAEVRCWGRNDFGQAGGGDMMDSVATPTVVPLDVGSGVLMVAAGRHHTCAAVDAGNDVWCWGRNHCNQVDDAAGTTCNTANVINAYDPVQLQAGQDHTCALVEDARIFCWGGRSGYNLGTPLTDLENIFPPTEVTLLGEIDADIVEFGVGDVHMCGRADDGRLWCWGENGDKQLGVGVEMGVDRLLEVDLSCP